MPEILSAGEIGRLAALSGNAATNDKIPIYDTSLGQLRYATPDQIASGASAVDGPASATDNAAAVFDGTTGKLIKNSTVIHSSTTNTFNNGATDIDFTVNKLTSGTAINYDAGTDALTLNGATIGATGAITLTGDVGIAGATSELSIAKTTNQLILGTTNTTTLNAAAPAASITSNLPTVAGTIATTTGANLFYADVTRCTSSLTKNGSTAYSNITGLSQTVVPGTYQFVCRLPSTVAGGTEGIKYAFNYTTTVLSSIEATGRGFTAAAVAVQHTTTTTTQTDLFTQAAVVIYTEISGTMVVGTGGTIDLQMAQNTSGATNTVTLIGASMEFIRIA